MGMMRFLGGVVLMAAIMSAAPMCSVGTLESYLNLPEGCTIGDKTFSQWQYSGSAQGGATPVPASVVWVVPEMTAFNPGFVFSANWRAEAGQIVDSHIMYTVMVPQGAPPLHDLHLEIVGYDFAGGGAVVVTETTNPLLLGTPLIVYAHAGGVVPVDAAIFAPVTGSWRMTKDILVHGGPAGAGGWGTVSSVINRYSEVPEPLTLSLIGIGLLGLGLLRRRTK